MTSIRDEIADQRQRVAELESEVEELRVRLAAHQPWLRIADPAHSPDHAEEIGGVQSDLAALEEDIEGLHRLRVGLDTLDSGTTDPDVVEEPAEGQRIGVLLPLRLETRFRFLHPDQGLDEPDSEPDDPDAEWRLLVRVEPDAMAFSAPPAAIVLAEAQAVAEAWNRCEGRLDGDAGAEAFDMLAARVGGPARAAYLLRSVPVEGDNDNFGLPSDADYPEVRPERDEPFLGLPDTLRLWADRGSDPELLGELQPDRDAILAQARPDAIVDPDKPGAPLRTWWTSFSAALDVGLAVEVRLGAERPSFRALYCTGSAVEDDGTVSPAALFGAHAESGRLGTLAPLTATNTVAGAPTTDTGRDPAPWLEVSRAAPDDLGGLARALTGKGLLPGVPRPDRSLAEGASSLITTLWPALWQRSLKDVYGADLASFRTGDWASRHLHPFGGLPVLRVGDLPYGVLPIADFDAWRWRRPGEAPQGLSDPLVEERLLEACTSALGPLVESGEAAGSAAGGDAERLLDVLAKTPVSSTYGSRSTGPTALVAAMFQALGAQAMLGGASAYLDEWNARAERLLKLTGGDVLRRYSPVGAVRAWPDPRRLAPDHREVLKLYFASSWRELVENGDLSGHWHITVRDPETGDPQQLAPPVLARLVRHALLLTQAEVTRAYMGKPVANVVPVHEPGQLARDAEGDDWEALVPELPERVLSMIQNGSASPHLVEAVRQFEDVRDAVSRMFDQEPGQVQQALPAVLDTTGHRVDAWFAAIASRRLAEQSLAGVTHVLGAYGWVDDLEPSIDRTPPTGAGLLHTPGYAQALTAAVLRDHVVHQPDDPRWQIGLHSAQVRLAAQLADEVRAGVHLGEALGREVERRVGLPGQVNELRTVFPARPEWAGRRVCDGIQVLAATRREDPDAGLAALAPDWLVPEHGDQLEDLQQVVDTYADLLLADAVHDVVDGRPRAAAEALEAAAGLSAPPEMRVLRTRREGGTVRTTVRVAVPWPAHPESFGASGSSPAGVADPAVANLLETELGQASTWTWTRSDGGTETDLESLGLRVADLLVAPTGSVVGRVERALGGPADGGTGAAKLAQAGRLVAAMGGSFVAEGREPQLRERLTELRRLIDLLLSRPEASGGMSQDEALPWGLADPSGYRTALQNRLAEAGPSASDPRSGVEELSRRIRALLPPTLGLPLVCPEVMPGGVPDASLDDGWLPVVAAVRPSLAALEVAQLTATILPWGGTSSVGDAIWAAPALSKDGHPGADEIVVHYGPAVGSTPGGTLAGIITIDSWAETVPSPRHTTWTAFGYDGPRARAPQAVLVVVPPDATVPLDEQTVLGAVRHARRQARARAVPAVSEPDLFLGLPTASVLVTGDAGCDLVREA